MHPYLTIDVEGLTRTGIQVQDSSRSVGDAITKERGWLTVASAGAPWAAVAILAVRADGWSAYLQDLAERIRLRGAGMIGAGTVVMGVAFLLFLPFAGGGPNSTPLLALAGILLVFTIAELLLSPVGLSLATKLAPHAFRTQMVALFFLSVALGTAASGSLAGLYSADRETAYLGILGTMAIILGLVLAAGSRPISRLMGGVR